MAQNFLDLVEINEEIGRRETRGDAAYFAKLLAPAFAMRRARPGAPLTDRGAFLTEVRASPERRTTDITVVVELDRCAVVTCLVQMNVDGAEKSFHNTRLFVREASGAEWFLMGWANEEVTPP